MLIMSEAIKLGDNVNSPINHITTVFINFAAFSLGELLVSRFNDHSFYCTN